ncbi:glycosyltransferase family 2 protein [Geomesophilobacter sediminis]|uniref:Glycosyltransferase family 2 protein n=1 Tax=Geomesophilobacter sediminis TaxID=2798584 RepID=A0A8J7M2J8_9BACT|nr:glycosyltransferase family 2 protein [Geomesophilobacter sediminis]MBJ6727560.1 glycosyltransferase family 2 protein [Geomesophilobacter sediminis]
MTSIAGSEFAGAAGGGNEAGRDPLVSVIVPTRDRSSLLRRALQSIRSQDLSDFEVLVVDDGSSCEHRAALQQLRGELDGRFRFMLSSPEEVGCYGPAENRNRGLTMARGRFIAFLDDDDHWLAADHLSAGVALLEQEAADFLFGTWSTEADGNIVIPDWNAAVSPILSGPIVSTAPPVLRLGRAQFCRAMRRHPIAHLNTCIVRADLARSVGGFWRPIHYAEDLHFASRIVDRARAILYRTDPVGVLDVSPRPRAFSAYSDLSKCLLNATMAGHLALYSVTPECRALSRHLLSWSYKRISDSLRASGNYPAALQFSLQSVASRVSVSSVQSLMRSLWELLRHHVAPPTDSP